MILKSIVMNAPSRRKVIFSAKPGDFASRKPSRASRVFIHHGDAEYTEMHGDPWYASEISPLCVSVVKQDVLPLQGHLSELQRHLGSVPSCVGNRQWATQDSM